jgi:hypothetical protein
MIKHDLSTLQNILFFKEYERNFIIVNLLVLLFNINMMLVYILFKFFILFLTNLQSTLQLEQ